MTLMHSSVERSHRLHCLKAADFGLFGATWWPRASLERLRIVTYLAIWVRTQPGDMWLPKLRIKLLFQLFTWYDGKVDQLREFCT